MNTENLPVASMNPDKSPDSYLAMQLLLQKGRQICLLLMQWEGEYLSKALRVKLIYVQADPEKKTSMLFCSTVSIYS